MKPLQYPRNLLIYFDKRTGKKLDWISKKRQFNNRRVAVWWAVDAYHRELKEKDNARKKQASKDSAA